MLQKKIENVVAESKGHLERATAENLVDEIINLRRANPRRRDELLSTNEVEEDINASLDIEEKPKSPKKPLVEQYESLFMLASNCRDLKLVLMLYDEVQQRKVPLTPPMLNVMLKSCIEDGNPTRAKMAFEEALRIAEQAVDAVSYLFAMRAYISLGDHISMMKVFSLVGEIVSDSTRTILRGDHVKSIVCTYILGLVLIGRQTAAIGVYEMMQQENPELVRSADVQMAMIESYSNQEVYDSVARIFEELLADNVRVPHATIARVIHAYLRLAKAVANSKTSSRKLASMSTDASSASKKLSDKAKSIFQIFQKSELSEALWPWEKFVQLANSDEGLPKALPSCEDTELLDLVREQPTKQRYEDAIVHYATGGDLVLADNLVEEWKNRFPEEPLTTKIMTALFRGGSRLGNSKYVALFDELEGVTAPDKRLPPSLARTLLRFHVERKDIHKATESIYKIMSKYPEALDEASCEEAMQLFISSPSFLVPKGKQLYYQLVDNYPSSTLSVNFFNTSISMFTRAVDSQGISHALAEIKKRNLFPNAGTYSCLMYLYLKKPDYKLVVATYTQMLELKIAPNTSCVMSLIAALGESKSLSEPKTVLFIKDQLELYDIKPDETLIQVLKKATTASDNPNAFGMLLRALVQKYDLSLSPGNYASWITALLECDQIKRALELAAHVFAESRKRPHLLTHSFCTTIALYVSKEGGEDLQSETVDRWISSNTPSQTPLQARERVQFERDLKHWQSLFPEDSVISIIKP